MDEFDQIFAELEAVRNEPNSFVYKHPITGETQEGIGEAPLNWGEYPTGVETGTTEANDYDAFRSQFYPLPHVMIEGDLGEESKFGLTSPEVISMSQNMPEDSQLNDPNWISASRLLHDYMHPDRNSMALKDETGESFATWGINLMTAFDYNFSALAVNAVKLNNAPPEVAKAMYYLMETADREGMTLKNFGKGALAMAVDPFNLGVLATFGIGVAGKYAGQQVTKMGFKELLKNIIISTPTKASVATGAEAGFLTMADNLARQEVKINAEVQDDFNMAEARISGGAGVLLGDRATAGMASVLEGGRRMLVGAGKQADNYLANNPDTGTTLNMGADPTRPIAEGLSSIGKALDVENTNTGIISARLPTAVNSTEDGITNNLQIGSADILNDTKNLEKNITVIKDYPNLTADEINGSSKEVAETYIEHMKNNLLWLHDKVPEKTRVRSKLWYDGANQKVNELSKEYNLPANSIAGVFASLSPQKDWFMNASLGMRVIDILSKQQDFMFSKEMMDIALNGYIKNGKPKKGIFRQPQYSELLEYIKGKKLSELETSTEKAMWLRIYDETYNDPSYKTLTPEGNLTTDVLNDDGKTASSIAWNSNGMIAKAIDSFYSGGDSKVLSPLMGSKHKVRSFYNNIIDPKSLDGSVTIDTHAVAGATLRPVSGNSTIVHHNFGTSPEIKKRQSDWNGAVTNSAVTGVKGSYGLYAEAYRRASAERGLLPREMQSITWEAIRGLYTKGFKQNDANIEKIDNMWYQYRDGKLTLDEVRDGIEQYAGGINKPQWEE
jgi:hypothetical protein